MAWWDLAFRQIQLPSLGAGMDARVWGLCSQLNNSWTTELSSLVGSVILLSLTFQKFDSISYGFLSMKWTSNPIREQKNPVWYFEAWTHDNLIYPFYLINVASIVQLNLSSYFSVSIAVCQPLETTIVLSTSMWPKFLDTTDNWNHYLSFCAEFHLTWCPLGLF